MAKPKIYPALPRDMVDKMHISAKFAVARGLWDGKEVCVEWVRARGNHRSRTAIGACFGVLVLSAGNEQQIGVKPYADSPDEDMLIIHVNRSTQVYDPSRKANPRTA